MNQALGKFEVCCKKPPTAEILVETVESLPAGLPVIDPAQSTQQSSKQSLPSSPSSSSSASSPSSCPALGPLPPISACAGRQSNCWSVGVRDLDCLDSALCCFDGCANVCLGRGERELIQLARDNMIICAVLQDLLLVILDHRAIPDYPQPFRRS